MKRLIVAAITAAATLTLTVGCGSTSSTSMGAPPTYMYGSAQNDRLCQTLRSYKDRGMTSELQESCVRQLGADNCKKCLTAP
jgi:hypothetical protein